MFSDPFGLRAEECPPCGGTGPGAPVNSTPITLPDINVGPDADDGSKLEFSGVGLNLFFGAGVSVAVGGYSNAQGSGLYVRAGGGPGVDLGINVEGGESTSRTAFSGTSEGAGVSGDVVSFGTSQNAHGTTITGGLGWSPLLAGAHSEVSNTWTSRPRPVPDMTPDLVCVTASIGLAPYCGH